MSGTQVRVWRADLQPGRLPAVCHATGEPTEDTMKYSFSTSPAWVWLFVLIGLLPLLIAMMVTAKRARGVVPLVRRKHLRLNINRYGGAVLLLVSIVIFFAGGAIGGQAGGVVVFLGLLLLLASLVWLILRSLFQLRGKVEEVFGMPDALVTLQPVHPNFAAAVIAMYEERVRLSPPAPPVFQGAAQSAAPLYPPPPASPAGPPSPFFPDVPGPRS